jgi:hypothetical protein
MDLDGRTQSSRRAGFTGSDLVSQLSQEETKAAVVDNLVGRRRERLDGLPATQVQLARRCVNLLSAIPGLSLPDETEWAQQLAEALRAPARRR